MAEEITSFFMKLEERIQPGRLEGINAVFQFNIHGEGGGSWYVILDDGVPSVTYGQNERPSVTFTANVADWLDIIQGKLNGASAFLSGRLRIDGDMTLALKLQGLLG